MLLMNFIKFHFIDVCVAGEMMQAALEAGVAQLLEMGYSRSKAIDALQECHCDVEMAVEYLAATCC
jgi:hypothetical protein